MASSTLPDFIEGSPQPEMLLDFLKPDDQNSVGDKTNTFQDINVNANNEDDYQPSAEELEMAMYLQEYINQETNQEIDQEHENYVNGLVDLHDDRGIDHEVLPCPPVAGAQRVNTPMTPPRFGGGDGHNSSPDQPEKGSSPMYAPSTLGDNFVAGQNEPMHGQNSIEEYHTSATFFDDDVVETNAGSLSHHGEQVGTSNKDLTPDVGQAGADHAVEFDGNSLSANLGHQIPTMTPIELINYSWQTLQRDNRVPAVLKTKETYSLIQNMVMAGGEGLGPGLGSGDIVALPKVQHFLANVMHISNALPSAGFATANQSISRNNTQTFQINANNGVTYRNSQQLISNNLANSGNGSLSSEPSFQRSAIEGIVQRLGGLQAFRERYVQWRVMGLRPLTTSELSTLNVLAQADVEEFLGSMDGFTVPNVLQRLGSLPANSRQATKNNTGAHQQRRMTEQVTGRSPNKKNLGPNGNERSSCPLSEAELAALEFPLPTPEERAAIVQKYVDAYKKHPAAVLPDQPSLGAPIGDLENSVAVVAQRTSPAKAQKTRAVKPAAQRKSPIKAPKPMHPHAVLMYKHFGCPVPGEEEEGSNQNGQAQTVAEPKANTPRRQQRKSNGNVTTSGAQPIAPTALMANVSQQAMAPVSLSGVEMLELQELRRTVEEQKRIIKGQHDKIQVQHGAIEAQKYITNNLISQLSTNQNNVRRVVPGHASGLGYHGVVPSIEKADDGSISLKRSASGSESSMMSKRRCGAAHHKINPFVQLPETGPVAVNTQNVGSMCYTPHTPAMLIHAFRNSSPLDVMILVPPMMHRMFQKSKVHVQPGAAVIRPLPQRSRCILIPTLALKRESPWEATSL